MSRGDTVSVDRSDFGTFIHSELDDAELSIFAFRIYCHLARRANIDGKAWPGAMSMARVCKMSENSVRAGIKELEDRGMLRVKRSKGGRESNHYFLTGKKSWGTGTSREGHPFTTGTPPLHVVNPTPSPQADEGIPVRNSKKDIPKGEEFSFLEEVANEESDPAEIIYKAYPRHVAKAAALKAIRAALKKIGFDRLLAAVEGYAAVTVAGGAKLEFLPYPATWMNQERWTDYETTNPRNKEHGSDSPDKW